jgi:hypothetical protein
MDFSDYGILIFNTVYSVKCVREVSDKYYTSLSRVKVLGPSFTLTFLGSSCKVLCILDPIKLL